MNARMKLHSARLKEWAARCADQKSSGLTVRSWCDQNHVSVHSFNYWKHLLREELADRLLPDIAPLAVPSLPVSSPVQSSPLHSVSFRINSIPVELDPSTPADLIEVLVKAVCHA